MTDEEKIPESAFESIQAEKVEGLYHNADLISPQYELFRLNTERGRIYFRQVGDGTFRFYGGTGNLTSEIPKDDALINWFAKQGIVAAKRQFYMRMLFGSFEHSLLAELCIVGRVELDELGARLREYFFKQSFYVGELELSEMTTEAQKDVIGMNQWIIDHKAKIYFVELPVFSDSEGLATQIDIGAQITLEVGSGKNYKTEECFALVNYKSSKGGFYKEHKFQLEVERRVFLDCFPDFEKYGVRIFNLSGSNWRSTEWNRKTRPYKFAEQTDKVNADRYVHYLELGKITRDERLAKPLKIIQGAVDIGVDGKQCVVEKTLQQIVEENIWQRFTKTGAAIPESLQIA